MLIVSKCVWVYYSNGNNFQPFPTLWKKNHWKKNSWLHSLPQKLHETCQVYPNVFGCILMLLICNPFDHCASLPSSCGKSILNYIHYLNQQHCLKGRQAQVRSSRIYIFAERKLRRYISVNTVHTILKRYRVSGKKAFLMPNV